MTTLLFVRLLCDISVTVSLPAAGIIYAAYQFDFLTHLFDHPEKIYDLVCLTKKIIETVKKIISI